MQPNLQNTAFYPLSAIRNAQQFYPSNQNSHEIYSNREYLNGSTADMFSSTFAVLSSDSTEMNNEEW